MDARFSIDMQDLKDLKKALCVIGCRYGSRPYPRNPDSDNENRERQAPRYTVRGGKNRLKHEKPIILLLLLILEILEIRL